MSDAGLTPNNAERAELMVARGHLIDETGHVIVDVPCRNCGYNIRGLNASGACPECGTATSYCLSPDLLMFANPDWLRQLVVGCNRIAFAVGMIVASYLALIFASFGFSMWIGFWIGEVWIATMILLWVVAGTGIWKITRRVPGAGRGVRAFRSATIALGFFCAGSTSIALTLILDRMSGVTVSWWLGGALGALLFASVFLTFAALFFYECEIARRLPDERLRTTMLTMGLAWCATFVLCSASILFDYVTWMDVPNLQNDSVELVQTAARIISGLLIMYVITRTIELHIRLARRLRAKERIARANWELQMGRLK